MFIASRKAIGATTRDDFANESERSFTLTDCEPLCAEEGEEKMYSVKQERMPEKYDYRQQLVITDDEGQREYSDGGEPEDNSFGRDWYWVQKELLKAYEQGKKDGASNSERSSPISGRP